MASVEYNSNNSGGSWWLNDEDWHALEADGWEVDWYANRKKDGFIRTSGDGRWLGALAGNATLKGATLDEAVERFERVTGACATDAGCPCCGVPHNFTEYDDDGRYVRSGPESYFSASF